MATFGARPDEGGFQALFDSSREPRVHTSVAAELGFLFGLVSLLSAPFAVMHAVTLGSAVLALMCELVGLATTSRPFVAGRALVPLGMLLAFVALALVGMRYVGVDTAFGDALVPTLVSWLETLNSVLPRP